MSSLWTKCHRCTGQSYYVAVPKAQALYKHGGEYHCLQCGYTRDEGPDEIEVRQVIEGSIRDSSGGLVKHHKDIEEARILFKDERERQDYYKERAKNERASWSKIPTGVPS